MIVIVIFFICLIILLFFKIRYFINQKDNFEVIEIKEFKSDSYNKKKKLYSKNEVKNDDPKNIDIPKKILLKCFDNKKIEEFDKKYGKYIKTIVYKDQKDNMIKGVINITPSKYIKEIPQITLNGYFINNFCVDPKYRNKGIGKKIIKYIISKAKKEDKLHLMLQIEKGEKSQSYFDFLLNFYLDLGFKQYASYEGLKILIHNL